MGFSKMVLVVIACLAIFGFIFDKQDWRYYFMICLLAMFNGVYYLLEEIKEAIQNKKTHIEVENTIGASIGKEYDGS